MKAIFAILVFAVIAPSVALGVDAAKAQDAAFSHDQNVNQALNAVVVYFIAAHKCGYSKEEHEYFILARIAFEWALDEKKLAPIGIVVAENFDATMDYGKKGMTEKSMMMSCSDIALYLPTVKQAIKELIK